MKDEYENVDDFIGDVMPIEFRSILHSRTKPKKRGSDSAAYKFEEKLEAICKETDEAETAVKDERKKKTIGQ